MMMKDNTRVAQEAKSSAWVKVWLSLFGLVTFSVGCDTGPKLIEAGGTVRYQSKPVVEADIVFIPDAGGPFVLGRSDDQGKFILSTDGKPGALAGAYKIGINAMRQKRPVSEKEAPSMTDAQIAANHESVIPRKYNHQITSGLTATVSDDPQANQFNLDLK